MRKELQGSNLCPISTLSPKPEHWGGASSSQWESPGCPIIWELYTVDCIENISCFLLGVYFILVLLKLFMLKFWLLQQSFSFPLLWLSEGRQDSSRTAQRFFQNRAQIKDSSRIFQDSSITWKFGTSWAEQRVWMIQIILPRILFPNSSFVLPLLPFKMTKNLGPIWGFLVAQTLHPSSLRRVFGACSWGWVSLPSHQRAPGPGQGVAFAPAWPLGRFLGTFAWRKMGQSQALTSPAKPPLEITGRDFWGSLEGWMSSPHSSFHLFH